MLADEAATAPELPTASEGNTRSIHRLSGEKIFEDHVIV
jgi:hypothetical protein